MSKIKIGILTLIIVLGAVFVSGCIGEEEVNPESLVTIQSEKFNVVPEGEPLYDAGYSATIEMEDGNKTYFVSDYAYGKLLSYFGTNGTDKPFKAEVEKKQVLYNDNADVIVDVYDMNGNKLEY